MNSIRSPHWIAVLSLSLFVKINAASQTDFWQQMNGPYGGRCISFAVTASGDLLAGTYGSGVFRSSDSGESWTQIGLVDEAVNALAINSDGHLFAGTGFVGFNGWVYRSLDDGISWTQLSLTGNHIHAIAVSSAGNVFAGTDVGLYRSSDDGESWDFIGPGTSSGHFILVHTDGSIFVGGLAVGGGGSRISRSSDEGSTWEQIYTGPTTNHYVSSLSLSPDGNLYAGINIAFGAGSSGEVIRSTDNGSNWLPTGLTNVSVLSLGVDSNGNVFAGAVDGVFRSTDDGGSWTNTLLNSSDVYALTFDPNSYLFAGTAQPEGGDVLRTSDNGDTWATVGLPGSTVHSITVNSGDEIYAGVVMALFRSADMGYSWSLSLSLYPTSVISSAIDASGHIFLGTDGSAIFRSTDNGASWINLDSGLTDVNVKSIAFGPGGEVYAGTSVSGVFRSTDNGLYWTPMNNGLTNTSILSLAVTTGGTVFAGTTSGVFRSIDGANWEETSATNSSAAAIAINQSNHVFVGASAGTVILQSTDLGETWQVVYNSPTTPSVSSLAINSQGEIFAGIFGFTNGGILLSSDDGTSWTQVNTGLTNTRVQALAVSTSGYVYVGTERGGIYRSSQSTTSARNESFEFPLANSLKQNYPNPFNPTTTIEFVIPESVTHIDQRARAERKDVSLRIFDILGHEITTLVHGQLSPGSYKVQWDASGYASGIYFYRLEAGNFVETKKLMLLR
jgi:ligand-binding sensor domain-containing protein